MATKKAGGKKAGKKATKKASTIKPRVIDLSTKSLAANQVLRCPGTCQSLTVVTAARQPRGLIVVL